MASRQRAERTRERGTFAVAALVVLRGLASVHASTSVQRRNESREKCTKPSIALDDVRGEQVEMIVGRE
jgi:hypothetical protein